MNLDLAPEWLKRLWRKFPLVVAVAMVIAAAGVIIVFIWPVTDLIASHDVGLITGPTRAAALQTAREAVRTQMLTLGAGVFAAGALVYTAWNFRLSRSTFRATEKRVLNERFIAITAQLGDDKAAVQLAGVHAMAGLADDWEENRQTCIDVLCAYLRLPYAPDPGDGAAAEKRLVFRADREVRHTVIRVIAAHLRPDAPTPWQGLRFDFNSVIFDGGDFGRAQFSGGLVSFVGAQFSGGEVSFGFAEFSGATVDFFAAQFSGGTVSFGYAQFSGGTVSFDSAQFSGGAVDFWAAQFSGGAVSFVGAQFFSGGAVSFGDVQFSGATVSFDDARFSGGEVNFGGAQFSGAEVDFSNARDWSHPPRFDWEGTPPAGVKLPTGSGSESQ